MTGGVELRVRDERAVVAWSGDDDSKLDLRLGIELTDALDEWARVAEAVRRTGTGVGGDLVSRRGRQLVARLAEILDEPVRYRDPLSGALTVVHPPRLVPRLTDSTSRQRPAAPAHRFRGWGTAPATPWATGLTVAAFVAVFVFVAMLALARSLEGETAGWVAVLASAVVTGGISPSLWLGRAVPVVRWIVLGAVAGLGLAWVGVLFIAFA